MERQVLWVVSGMCALTLIGVFWKMKPGFGPNNLQAVGIVLIAFLASVLSILRPDGLNAAMGILGAVGGYLIHNIILYTVLYSPHVVPSSSKLLLIAPLLPDGPLYCLTVPVYYLTGLL